MHEAFSINLSRLQYRGIPAWLVLICICLPLLTLNLGGSPSVWFDEGYKMNAARTLAERGVYGTYTVDGYQPFDPGISSGPADMLPLAASFALFGTGVVQARLVFVAYSLLMALTLYALGSLIFGPQAGLLAALLVIAVPPLAGTSLLAIGRQALGEAPALALILSGVLLWARSWERPGAGVAFGAGLLLGLGLLSKTQIGIALLPAMLLITVGRCWRRPGQLLRELLPVVVMLGVIAGWALLGRALTDEASRRENAVMLLDAIRTNLLTGLWGRTLSRTALALTAIMATAAILSGLRLWTRSHMRAANLASWWAEAFLACFVALYALWFALLSVGWPRYSYAGLMVALLLLGGAIGRALEQAQDSLGMLRRLSWLLVGVALLGQLAAVALAPASDDARRTANYLDATIARDAVVETWEWELSALGRHTAFHHPHQRYLFLTIRQFSHQQTQFNLQYDALQVPPDYLVIGPFGEWTQIYSPDQLEASFTLVERIGRYQLYKRIR
jgi:4-amino-4-deoxy-L-arabinose transferase-like glycosyltransferase